MSGGENVDDVVILSRHASWNSVHDFHAKNAQNASDIRSTAIMQAGAELEKFAVDSAKADDEAVAAVYVKAGAKVADLDEATLLKWQALAKPIWKDYAGKNENCAKLLALAQKLL